VHGLAIFFESELVPGIGLTTAPGNDLAYGRAVLPLMDPFPIAFGDTIRVTVRAASGGQRWAWDVEHGERRSRQSTFFGNPATAAALARESSTHRPELTKQGARALRALGAMDGKTSVGEIAASLDGALDEVRDLVSRYAR